MITGSVNGRLVATVPLRLVGPAGSTADVEAIVDTGYTGMVAVPEAVVVSLGLTLSNRGSGILADGNDVEFGVYRAEVEWDGLARPVLVSALGSEVLLGMSLLEGHELRIEVTPGGAVEVRPLPP